MVVYNLIRVRFQWVFYFFCFLFILILVKCFFHIFFFVFFFYFVFLCLFSDFGTESKNMQVYHLNMKYEAPNCWCQKLHLNNTLEKRAFDYADLAGCSLLFLCFVLSLSIEFSGTGQKLVERDTNQIEKKMIQIHVSIFKNKFNSILQFISFFPPVYWWFSNFRNVKCLMPFTIQHRAHEIILAEF